MLAKAALNVRNDMSKKKYAVLVEASYHVEGDERSRTNPGHGYPAHTVDYISVVKFEDVTALTRWVEEEEARQYGKQKYTVIEYVELEVKKSVDIQFHKE
jgi:hypothetical protein